MLEQEYHAYQRGKKRKFIFLSFAVIFIFLSCLTWGTPINLYEGAAALAQYLMYHTISGPNEAADKVIIFLRLPRLCLAVLAGIGLAVSGLMMQSVTRNFLVSPFTLGVSSAAAFGASLCIVFGSATIFFNEFWIIGSAFLFAMSSVVVIFLITRKIGLTAGSIILVGIAMNYFFAACTASLQFFAQENKLAAVVQWTFGTFNRANWSGVIIIAAVLLLCFVFVSGMLQKWNIMASGDDELVKSLGIDPDRLRGITMFWSVLLTATIISFTGVIGFVGLIGPHIARFLVGNDQRYLFPLSAVVGAGLLLTADTVGLFILYPVAVPVGIVVSFIGVPIFVHLVLSSRKGELQ